MTRSTHRNPQMRARAGRMNTRSPRPARRVCARFRGCRRPRWVHVLLLVTCVLAVSALPAESQETRATVRIDGRPVFRVGATDSVTAAERSRRIERRLATLLETPRSLGPAQAAATASDSSARVITVSGVPIVTITRADAEDNLASVDGLAAQWALAIDSSLSRAAERRLSGSGRFVAEVRAAVRAAFSRLSESAIRIVPRVLAALLVVGLFWLIASAVRRLMRLFFRRVVDDLTIENLIKQASYYAIWALGLIVAIDALGFHAETVVAGLGLTGLALGFALKDIISNFVSGILILALRPFELGDQIVVGETEGSVERIRLRATDVRTYDGRLVLVPNAELFTSRITNNTASPMRRASVLVHLAYESDLRRSVEALREAAAATPGVLPEPPVTARVRDLGADDLVMEVRFWTDSRRSDFTATQAAVRAEAVAALRRANVGLPDPGVRKVVQQDGAAAAPRGEVAGTGSLPDE